MASISALPSIACERSGAMHEVLCPESCPRGEFDDVAVQRHRLEGARYACHLGLPTRVYMRPAVVVASAPMGVVVFGGTGAVVLKLLMQRRAKVILSHAPSLPAPVGTRTRKCRYVRTDPNLSATFWRDVLYCRMGS
jgi:hypothetical protein